VYSNVFVTIKQIIIGSGIRTLAETPLTLNEAADAAYIREFITLTRSLSLTQLAGVSAL
jgi:hypothetical protein